MNSTTVYQLFWLLAFSEKPATSLSIVSATVARKNTTNKCFLVSNDKILSNEQLCMIRARVILLQLHARSNGEVSAH